MVYYSWRDTVYLTKTVVYQGTLYYPGEYSRTKPLPEPFLNSDYVFLIALDDGYVEPNPYPTGSGGSGSVGLSGQAFVTTLNTSWKGYYVPSDIVDNLPWMDVGGSDFILTVSGCNAGEKVLILVPGVCFQYAWQFALWRRPVSSDTWTMVDPGVRDLVLTAENGLLSTDTQPTTYGLDYGSVWGDTIYGEATLPSKIDIIPAAGDYKYKFTARATLYAGDLYLGRNSLGLQSHGQHYSSQFIGIKLGT